MRSKYKSIPGFLLISCAAGMLLSPFAANAGIARCYMHGIYVPKLENKEKTSLSDYLRMNFDVKTPDDKAKCEQFMEAYCIQHIKGKDYSPSRMKGSFKPDVDKTDETNYKFTESCKLETD